MLEVSADDIFRLKDEATRELPKRGIDVVKKGRLRKPSSRKTSASTQSEKHKLGTFAANSVAKGALIGAVAGGFLPITGHALGAIIGSLIGHLVEGDGKKRKG